MTTVKTIHWVSLNWPEAARLIKIKKPESVYAYVKGLEWLTGGYIYRNGAIVPYKNRPTPWVYSTIEGGNPVMLKFVLSNQEVEEMPCETTEVSWELGSYWPEEIAALLKGE
jgi:hypothetical protein